MTALQPQLTGIPIPRMSPESTAYWEGTRLGELRYQQCVDCGAPKFGPGLVCRVCHGRSLRWAISVGLGSLYSWTVVWRPQTPAFAVPYAPAIVRMDEGYDLLTALVGIDPDDINESQRLRVEFHSISDEITLPFFGPA